MSKIELNLSQTSDSPGWIRDDYSEHNAYWRETAARYTYTTAVDPNPVHSDRGSFDSAWGDTQINLIEFPHTQVGNNPDTGAPAISIDWQDDESVDIALNRAWNTIKNIEIADFTGSALRISNFVDAWVHLDGNSDRDVTIDGVKRAEVTTGGGDDHVRIGIDSNTADWSNDLLIDAGGGDDDIRVGSASRDYTGDGVIRTSWTNGQIFAGTGDDVVVVSNGKFTIDGGDGSDHIYGGSGDDIIMGGDDTLNGNGGEPYHNILSGGSGNDTLIGAKWGTNEFRLGDFGPGDHVIGGNLTDTLYADFQSAAFDITALGNNVFVNGVTLQSVEGIDLAFPEEARVTITGDFSSGALNTISIATEGGNAPHETSFDVDAHGSSGVDVWLENDGGHGTFLGGGGDDRISLTTIDSRDMLEGGGGADELRFGSTIGVVGSIDADIEGKGSWIDIDGAKVSGIESITIDGGWGGSDQISVSGALADAGLRSVTYMSDDYTGDEGDTFDASGSTDAAVRFILMGGAGDDVFTGGAGNDTLSGGSTGAGDGADHFVFAPGSGDDEILGFHAGSGDIIDIAGYRFSSFEQLQEEGRITVMDGHTHIILSDNDSIDVHETGLTANDFQFD